MIRSLFSLVLVTLILISNPGGAQDNVESLTNGMYPEIFDLYQYLHSHPELSFREENTAKKLAQDLRNLGFETTENIGGHGFVSVMKNGPGPVVMVRTDLDALPVTEQTQLPYASRVADTLGGNEVGVMHACGHDVHMAVLVGTARILSQLKDRWSGTLIFIGQPAEERGAGARAMLNDGLYKRFPVPDFALALHCSASMEAGKVGFCSGYALANVDMMDIYVYGEGGHGAYPHLTIDPVVLSARLILDLQTIVSRELSPLEPAVVTVGSIHGGSKGNVIPSEVKLELTLRSYSDEVRTAIIQKIKRIANGLAQSAGLPEEKYPKIVVRDEYTPALYNDPELTARIRQALSQRLGEENVVQSDPVMGGEDFGRYGRTEENTPILLYWLGTVDPVKKKQAEKGEATLPSLHSPHFAPDPEPAIKTGVKAMSYAVLELLQ